ncbi:MAG TPA: hypothetical protein V6D29_22120 [Leptolyngbyaceae cyanobacterium]
MASSDNLETKADKAMENEALFQPQAHSPQESNVPTDDDGNTPLDESERLPGQQAGTDVRPGAEAEAPGAGLTRPGLPNEGTPQR